MARIQMTINIKGIDEIKKILKEKYVSAQNVCTSECKKWSDVFTPFRDGNLKNNFEYIKENGVFVGFRYKEPYARKQWFGLTEDKRPFNYSTDKNPHARSKWTIQAIDTYGATIMRTIKKAIEG